MDAKDDPPSNKDGMLERSIEDIRSKMKEKRRKKIQADLSSSRSRYKNANLILKTSLRMNNRSLAKSLEVAQTEFRQTQQALLELQRERQLLQSVINRYQEQHSKQRNQISGVRDLLNKVTTSLLDTVGILGQALDMCHIPRSTEDSSLGMMFRKSCATSDDDDTSSSDLEKRSAGRSAPSSNPNIFNQNIVNKKKLQKMSAHSKGPVGGHKDLCQDSSRDRPQDEIPDLPDIDIPLMFMSDDCPPSKKGKVTARRDTRNITPEELLPMPVSREDPGTNFTTDSEIKEVAEETEMMLNEAAAENPVRRKSSLDSNADLFDAVHVDTDGNEDELTEDVRVPRKRRSRQSKRDRAGGKTLDQTNDGKDGCKNDDAEEKRGKERRKKSGRRGKEEETVAPQQNLVEEEMEADLEAMEMGPDDDVNNGTASRRRSKRQLKRRGTFVKHNHEDQEAAVQLGISETKDEPASERTEAEIGGITGEGQPECSGKENNSSGKDASVIAQAEEIRHKVDGSSGKGNSIDPSSRQDKTSQLQKEKEDSSGNKSDYRLADMEMTSTALGHISVLESGRDRDVEAMSKGENNFEIGEERACGQPTSKKSKLPVMKKGKLQDKSKSSRLVKHSSKIPSKARSKKEKQAKTDDRDVAQMSIFDLSVGDSFSHPTPSRLHKPHPQTQPAPDAMASQEARMPEGDGDHNRSVRDSPSSAKTTELPHTHSSEGQENVGKHGVIKRKSRKSKSVVTPRNPEAKKVTSEKALLEELNNLDASYLSEVTNPERRSKIGSSLPSRKSSHQKEERESLSDLITRPLVRKSSNKRKLSKMQFFLELEDAENESRSLSLGIETEKKRSSKVSDMKLMDSCDDYADVPDCKGGQKSLNVTHDVLEDIDHLVSASNAQGKLKPVPRRTTILKSRKRTETSNLNVTFDLDVQSENDCAQMQVTHEPKNVHGDDHSRYSAKVLEECGKKSSNSNKSTEQYLIPSKCFDDELGHDKELTQGVARKKSCDSATENHERVRQDQHAPSPRETSDHQSADAHEVAGRNNMNSSKSKKRRAEDSSTGDREDKPHKVFRTDTDLPKVNGMSVSRVMTDVTNTLAAGEESREDEVVRTGGKGDLSAGDAMKENAPEVPQRRALRTKGVVSYKEPSGNKKLRQGDPFTDTVYKSIAPTKVPKA